MGVSNLLSLLCVGLRVTVLFYPLGVLLDSCRLYTSIGIVLLCRLDLWATNMVQT